MFGSAAGGEGNSAPMAPSQLSSLAGFNFGARQQQQQQGGLLQLGGVGGGYQEGSSSGGAAPFGMMGGAQQLLGVLGGGRGYEAGGSMSTGSGSGIAS